MYICVYEYTLSILVFERTKYPSFPGSFAKCNFVTDKNAKGLNHTLCRMEGENKLQIISLCYVSDETGHLRGDRCQ